MNVSVSLTIPMYALRHKTLYFTSCQKIEGYLTNLSNSERLKNGLHLSNALKPKMQIVFWIIISRKRRRVTAAHICSNHTLCWPTMNTEDKIQWSYCDTWWICKIIIIIKKSLTFYELTQIAFWSRYTMNTKVYACMQFSFQTTIGYFPDDINLKNLKRRHINKTAYTCSRIT